ncbi:MAG: hypothetical protein GXC78_04555 [Chitinophagaceae bacterium]|nr:hypothetical protein [Chitinophagaceae bacterium]
MLTIKLILAVTFLLIGGIAALRRYQRNTQMENAGKDISRHLEIGNVEVASLGEELNMLIRRKKVVSTENLVPRIIEAVSTQLPQKFKLLQKKTGNTDDGVIIAKAIIPDIEITRNGTQEVMITYPCWLYVKALPEDACIDFRSTIPQNKDHQYLLEDLADHAMAMSVSPDSGSPS